MKNWSETLHCNVSNNKRYTVLFSIDYHTPWTTTLITQEITHWIMLLNNIIQFKHFHFYILSWYPGIKRHFLFRCGTYSCSISGTLCEIRTHSIIILVINIITRYIWCKYITYKYLPTYLYTYKIIDISSFIQLLMFKAIQFSLW